MAMLRLLVRMKCCNKHQRKHSFSYVEAIKLTTFRFQVLQFWVQLPNGNWELGKIMSTSGEESVIVVTEGKVSDFVKFPG
jgi:hypothetical protein